MKNQILAVCDPEKDYALHFAEFLNRKNNVPFEVQAFTTAQSLMEYAKTNKIELLLISSEEMKDEICRLDIKMIVLLSEEPEVQRAECCCSVYKYQSAAEIFREAYSCYTECDNDMVHPPPAIKKSTNIYGVYSPLGRCFKTSFALALGLVLSDTRPVLLVNLEEQSGFEDLSGRDFAYTLSDLLYYTKQGDANLSVRLNGIVQSFGKLDFIPPVRSPEDIGSTGWQDWERLLLGITVHSSYETIILDLGNGINQIFSMLDTCGKIFMPVRSDVISQSKIRQFESCAKARRLEHILDKTVKISLPGPELSFQRRMWPEQLKWSSLGDYARELAGKEKL